MNPGPDEIRSESLGHEIPETKGSGLLQYSKYHHWAGGTDQVREEICRESLSRNRRTITPWSLLRDIIKSRHQPLVRSLSNAHGEYVQWMIADD